VIRGVAYFGLVFSVGFILGFFRVLWVVPLLGARTAEILEAPLMLAAIYFSSRYTTQRFKALRTVEYLYSGLVALVLLVSVEFSVVLGLQGLSIAKYLVERDPVAGAVYVFMLIIFAVMPGLVSKGRVAA
jgi:hypothetical protein